MNSICFLKKLIGNGKKNLQTLEMSLILSGLFFPVKYAFQDYRENSPVESEPRKSMKSLANLLRHIKYLSFTWSKLVFFNFSEISRRYFLKFPKNRCWVGQQPIICFQLKINGDNDFNGHFCIAIVTNVYSKKIIW